MKNEFSRFTVLLTLLLTLTVFSGKGIGQTTRVEGKWSGTVSLHEKYKGITGWSEKRIEVSFSDNIGTGTIKYEGETIIEGKSMGKTACNGAGPVELWAVEIYRPDSAYRIETIGPDCSQGPDPWSTGHGNDITIGDIPWNGNPNFLSGNSNNTVEIPGNLGTVTTTLSWSLYRGPLNAQLIITPNAYNIWMPKATKEELIKGSVMDIGLKVQGRNGSNSSLKAVRFELRLSNTSREPGTTLNTPLTPSANQLPDIRFLPHSLGESMDEDQYIEIPSDDGKTGKATIASYDGGGWTTLSAVAVLEGGFRIEGTLLTPTGIREIPIPKRNGTVKIAEPWLSANGNPGETDDKEKFPGHTYFGDGLSAYEEYRGVISEGQFIRLSPAKKELGVMAKQTEFPLFAGGISMFENASGLKVIRFSEDEILQTRQLNNNAGNAHVYDQYVLKIENGTFPGSAVGKNEPLNIARGIPRQSERIVIDVSKIEQNYQHDTAAGRAGNEIVPYTLKEKLDNTVAHEMGHGVNLIHHGDIAGPPDRVAAACDPPPCTIIYRVYDHRNNEIHNRPIPLENAGAVGSEESGDLSCIMAYTGMYQWAFRMKQGELNYYYITFQPVGKKLCTDIKGTGINKNQEYFGDSNSGNCISQVKLKD